MSREMQTRRGSSTTVREVWHSCPRPLHVVWKYGYNRTPNIVLELRQPRGDGLGSLLSGIDRSAQGFVLVDINPESGKDFAREILKR